MITSTNYQFNLDFSGSMSRNFKMKENEKIIKEWTKKKKKAKKKYNIIQSFSYLYCRLCEEEKYKFY